MSLTLDKRPCKIGTNLQIKAEFHGDEIVPCMQLSINDVMLSQEDLGELLNEPNAWFDMFSERDGAPPEPKAKLLHPTRKLAVKFEDSQAMLTLGLNDTVVAIVNCTIAKMTLTPITGGMTACTFTIQSTEGVQHAATIKEFFDTAQHIALQFGEPDDQATDEEQPELNLTMESDLKSTAKRGKVKPTPKDLTAH